MPSRSSVPKPSCLQANSEPLYRRLPKTDEHGRLLGDFMMLIPGLRELTGTQAGNRLGQLQALLDADDDVVFADLNLPLNLLWVSVRQRHGVISAVSASIREHLPAARLVGHTTFDRPDTATRSGLHARFARWARRLARLPRPRQASGGLRPRQ